MRARMIGWLLITLPLVGGIAAFAAFRFGRSDLLRLIASRRDRPCSLAFLSAPKSLVLK